MTTQQVPDSTVEKLISSRNAKGLLALYFFFFLDVEFLLIMSFHLITLTCANNKRSSVVVPYNWISDNKCAYPKFNSQKLEFAIKSRAEPHATWHRFPFEYDSSYGLYNSFLN